MYICVSYVYIYIYDAYVIYIYIHIYSQNPWNEEEIKYWHTTRMTPWTLICKRSD